MPSRYVLLVPAGLAVLTLLFLSVLNLQPVAVNAPVSFPPLPLGAIILVSLAAGAAAGATAASRAGGKVKSERIELEWQTQDAKLAAAVQSDREKQLEAKIATLETALKQALKKNS